MGLFDIRIVRTVDRTERALAGDAALEFFRHLLDGGFFERIRATAKQKGGAHKKESDREGFQARRILKKVTVTSDD